MFIASGNGGEGLSIPRQLKSNSRFISEIVPSSSSFLIPTTNFLQCPKKQPRISLSSQKKGESTRVSQHKMENAIYKIEIERRRRCNYWAANNRMQDANVVVEK